MPMSKGGDETVAVPKPASKPKLQIQEVLLEKRKGDKKVPKPLQTIQSEQTDTQNTVQTFYKDTFHRTLRRNS